MEKLKKLLKQRLDKVKDVVLSAIDKIQQLQIAPHTPSDYIERTQLIAEIFMRHLEDQRQSHIDMILEEVRRLQESNIILQAQAEYLKTLTESPSRRLQTVSDDIIKSRQLAELLSESEDLLGTNDEESLRRELTDKYERILQQQQDKHELEILQLKNKNLSLELQIAQLKNFTDRVSLSISSSGSKFGYVLQTAKKNEMANETIRLRGGCNSPMDHEFEELSSRKGMVSTIAVTPTKNHQVHQLTYKYIRNPISRMN